MWSTAAAAYLLIPLISLITITRRSSSATAAAATFGEFPKPTLPSGSPTPIPISLTPKLPEFDSTICTDQFKDPTELFLTYPSPKSKDNGPLSYQSYPTVAVYLSTQNVADPTLNFKGNRLMDAILTCLRSQMADAGLDFIKLPDFSGAIDGRSYDFTNGNVRNLNAIYRFRDALIKFGYPFISVFTEFGDVNVTVSYDVQMTGVGGVKKFIKPEPATLEMDVAFIAVATELKLTPFPEPKLSLDEFSTVMGDVTFRATTGFDETVERGSEIASTMVNVSKTPILLAFDVQVKALLNAIVELVSKLAVAAVSHG